MGAIERRDEYAAKILAGFAANPAIFAPNPQCGWSLVNCTDAEIVAYAVRLATHLFHATNEIGLEEPPLPSGTAPTQVSGTAEAGHSSPETRARWTDYGSLGNGRCSFGLTFNGAACCLPADHDGEHMTDRDRAAANRRESHAE